MDFTYDNVSFAGLPDYIREVKEEGLRFIIILDPAINAEVKSNLLSISFLEGGSIWRVKEELVRHSSSLLSDFQIYSL